ncbi:MAG: hypothetical protein JST00_38020 [Deltaproteobacteria bacterium]|nr:hypothetical protein [Deltaproteobacteria bacterium]
MSSMPLPLTTLSVRRLFLLDGIGAALSAVALALSTAFEPMLGAPVHVVVPLSLVAAGFAVYSLTCHVRAAGPRFLFGIAVANALYCLCTLSVVLALRHSLTMLGIAYFLGEVLVIATLVFVEATVARSRRE